MPDGIATPQGGYISEARAREIFPLLADVNTESGSDRIPRAYGTGRISAGWLPQLLEAIGELNPTPVQYPVPRFVFNTFTGLWEVSLLTVNDMAFQNSAGVSITGGSISGVTIVGNPMANYIAFIGGGAVDNAPSLSVDGNGYLTFWNQFFTAKGKFDFEQLDTDHLWTLPNLDGTFVLTSGVQTLANKTLTTPVIASFANAGHNHADAAGGGKLAQANTHESPDTDAGSSSLHHTLGTGANQAAAGNHSHTVRQSLNAAPNTTVPASSTRYHPISAGTVNVATEANARSTIASTGTLRNLHVRISQTQGANGALTVTLYKNGSATALTIIIAAGAVAGKYSNTAQTVEVTAQDEISFEWINAHNAASATITSVSLELTVTT